MSSEMVERIAKRLHAVAAEDGSPSWEDDTEEVREMYLVDGREALEAMRQPTAAMLAARPAGMSGACWAAMIEAELACG